MFFLQHLLGDKKNSLIFGVVEKMCLDAVAIVAKKMAGSGCDGQSVLGEASCHFFPVFTAMFAG